MHLDPSQLPQRRFTPAEFDALCKAGILGEDEPGRVHLHLVDRLTHALVRAVPDGLRVEVLFAEKH